ncbi:hypothetical protein EB052_01650, partial [bacterium]|nr:hypothetical protein [bacterium]
MENTTPAVGLTRPRWIALIIGLLVIISALGAVWSALAPSEFPAYRIVSIPQNTGLNESARILKADHVIRSETAFKVAAMLIGGRRSMKSGDYLFDTPVSVWSVAHRLVS